MDNLEEIFHQCVEQILAPFLHKYGFERRKDDTFISKNNYISITHSGFVPHDYPWQIDLHMGRPGFKKTTSQFDQVTLTYWKCKIAPLDEHSKNNMRISTETYFARGAQEIGENINQIVSDLEHFAEDFLKGQNERFDRMRTIKYLEYLTRANVYGTYYGDRPKEIVIKYNEPVE